ncbi:MAG: NAD(P)/FAD-dependent oxidoreductase [Thermomicrobiales bacterium]
MRAVEAEGGERVLMQRADVVVIGGGITGLGVAWRLRRLGVERVVVLEAGEAGFKSTGQASGGIRRQFETRLEIEMTLASLPFFELLLDDAAFDGRFNRVGYAFLAGPEQVGRVERACALQQAMGIDARWLDRADLVEQFPYCDLIGVVAGTFCADDGFIDPWAVVGWLVTACRAEGVTVRERSAVEVIEVADGRVRAVRTADLTVDVEVVVNAAGAWAGMVGALAGVEIPVSPSPRVKYVAGPHPALPEEMPLIVDLPTGAYVRSDQGCAMVGVQPRKVETSFEVAVAPGQVEWMAERAAARFPSLRGVTAERLITGLYEVTPDGLPVAGAAPGVEGLYVAAGFNGHGIMHGPAVAQAVAEEIVWGRAEVLDMDRLQVGRFAAKGVVEATAARAML